MLIWSRIDTWLDISKFGCLRRDGKHDKGGMHFFAIKYYIMGNPTEPETFERLDEWLHRLEEGEVWTDIWFDVRSAMGGHGSRPHVALDDA